MYVCICSVVSTFRCNYRFYKTLCELNSCSWFILLNESDFLDFHSSPYNSDIFVFNLHNDFWSEELSSRWSPLTYTIGCNLQESRNLNESESREHNFLSGEQFRNDSSVICSCDLKSLVIIWNMFLWDLSCILNVHKSRIKRRFRHRIVSKNFKIWYPVVLSLVA